MKNPLTDGRDEVIKVAVGEKRLGELSEEQLQGSRDDVDILPLAVLEVQLLCLDTTGARCSYNTAGGAAVYSKLLQLFLACAGSCLLSLSDWFIQFNTSVQANQ